MCVGYVPLHTMSQRPESRRVPCWQPMPGDVCLKHPTHIVSMTEDSREPEPKGGWSGDTIANDPAYAQAPTHLFLGRRLATGAASLLAHLSLSDRPYLGRTSLPPEYAHLMAVEARVLPGTKVLDPFCGTASILMSCAALGAETIGVEVDARVLDGTVDGQHGISANFDAAGLTRPAQLVLGDMASFDEQVPPTAGSRFARLDAIVTDPPYGLMEGLGPYYLPLGQRLTLLLRLACRRLRLGGRLVFLLPLPAHAEAAKALPDTLPTSRCLAIERISRQRLSLRMHRLMVTMVKVAEPVTTSEGLQEGEGRGAGVTEESSHPMRLLLGSEAPAAPWEEWWETVDEIEAANAGEADRVW